MNSLDSFAVHMDFPQVWFQCLQLLFRLHHLSMQFIGSLFLFLKYQVVQLTMVVCNQLYLIQFSLFSFSVAIHNYSGATLRRLTMSLYSISFSKTLPRLGYLNVQKSPGPRGGMYNEVSWPI